MPNEMEQKLEGWLETDERSKKWRGWSGRKVNDRGNGNKISGTAAIDERKREEVGGREVSERAGQLWWQQRGSVCGALLM